MENNSILVSYIVPIYNVEKYIKKCVESICNQNYKNIEIILVDDGSTDKSSKIIDSISEKDSRINVIHKKNGGVSSARNTGLDKAKGKYILFIDGDDYIEPDYTDYFLDLISKDNYDIAYSNKCFDLVNKVQIKENNIKIYSSADAIAGIYDGKFGVAVWNKIYKKSFLSKNNIRFNEDIWYGEGMLFNIQCLSKTNSVIVGDRMVYHQVFNPKSAMRKFNMNSNYCGIKSLDIQKEYIDTKNKRILNAWNYHKRCFNMSILIGILKSDTKDEYKEDYKKCKSNLRKNILVPLKANIPFKRKMLYLIAVIDPVFVAKIFIKRERNRLINYEN